MREAFPAVKAGSVRMIILIGVLASLCFSVGEGLRLLPLPPPPLRPNECAHTRPHIKSPSAATLNQFQSGSLCQPTQAQKNLKRKQTQWAPTSSCNLPLPHNLLLLSGAEWRTGFYPPESASEQAGRAPPPAA
jgi:hypothetical protein